MYTPTDADIYVVKEVFKAVLTTPASIPRVAVLYNQEKTKIESNSDVSTYMGFLNDVIKNLGITLSNKYKLTLCYGYIFCENDYNKFEEVLKGLLDNTSIYKYPVISANTLEDTDYNNDVSSFNVILNYAKQLLGKITSYLNENKRLSIVKGFAIIFPHVTLTDDIIAPSTTRLIESKAKNSLDDMSYDDIKKVIEKMSLVKDYFEAFATYNNFTLQNFKQDINIYRSSIRLIDPKDNNEIFIQIKLGLTLNARLELYRNDVKVKAHLRSLVIYPSKDYQILGTTILSDIGYVINYPNYTFSESSTYSNIVFEIED
ncbi:hypothetical protein DFR86_11685 [Acidianus sulfidivorans JP7]|uniref:Uncharacterized protein n=1 Tax=Acidianus sulfidivorans JP7 TaxID=619593 RepID=A0A2U9IQ32_9CREN|nr:hypothetical protein [Acidianus sulfidivorans]AWR98131.1 hypothetical protein DFR86_11685 [Acidianus sulfidivorans JP7]